KTPLTLFKEKRGLLEENSSYIMERGHDREKVARSLFQLQYDLDMTPMLIEHEEYPFVRCSLDGWNEEKKISIEIKYVGKESFAFAKEGKIPPKYYPQLQWQLLCTGAEKCYFVAIHDTNDIAVFEVLPNLPYMKMLLLRAAEFWGLVEKGIEPPLTPKDTMNLDQDRNWVKVFQKLIACKKQGLKKELNF